MSTYKTENDFRDSCISGGKADALVYGAVEPETSGGSGKREDCRRGPANSWSRPVTLPHGASMMGGYCAKAAESDQPMECRMAVGMVESGTAPEEIMIMPAGLHKVCGTLKGEPTEMVISVGPEAANAMQSALEAYMASGPRRPYFDFDHERGPASAWPTRFVWKDSAGASPNQAGVYAAVEWSKAGREAVEGKMYRGFSPAFFPDKQTPAKVIGAPLNMGGLVNEPAFKQISPLWAKAGEAPVLPRKESMAENSELAALQAKNVQLEKTIGELNAKIASSQSESAFKAKEAEVLDWKNKHAALEAKLAERSKADAKAAVDAAVARGAIPPKDEALQAKWRSLVESDPTNAELLCKLPGNPALQTVTTASAGGAGASFQAASGTEAEQFASAVKAKHAELKDRSKALDFVIGEAPKLYAAWREANGKPGLF